MYFKMQAENMREAILSFAIMSQLNFSPADVISGLMPWLETIDKSDLHETEVSEVLANYDYDQKTDSFDFEHYEEIIRKRKPDIYPQALVRYMYMRSPETALSTIANVYFTQQEAGELMEQVRNKDDAEVVKSFSDRQEWWVNIYAFGKMMQNPKLRDEEWIKALKQSENALLSETVREIEEDLDE